MEYELLDTGVFDSDRYFDVLVEYAKQGPTDILIQVSISNRGPDPATLHLLPTLWFRNIWSWWPNSPRPSLKVDAATPGNSVVAATDAELGTYYLHCEGGPPLLFTENETNNQRLFGSTNATPYVKDGINDFVTAGKQDAVNPQQVGTKAAAHYQVTVGAGQTSIVRLRLTNAAPQSPGNPFDGFADILAARQREADAFYRCLTPAGVSADAANVMRQALAGMLWSKQYYFFDVGKWLQEHGVDPRKAGAASMRNSDWPHMVNEHVISMPDKWEYPWFAAWDLAFQTIALAIVDVDFAKQQLDLLLQGFYLHPTGQIPAYEWNFSDVNPPVHAWATIFLYRTEQAMGRHATRRSSPAPSPSCRSTSPGGRTARTASARTSTRAASSASTISASSIAARRCRPAAISSRPTARRGWRCTARTCSRSASSWRRAIRPTRTWRPSSASSSCGSPGR